jgi:hypothetical protein
VSHFAFPAPNLDLDFYNTNGLGPRPLLQVTLQQLHSLCLLAILGRAPPPYAYFNVITELFIAIDFDVFFFSFNVLCFGDTISYTVAPWIGHARLPLMFSLACREQQRQWWH